MADSAQRDNDLERLRAARECLRAERDFYENELSRLRSAFAGQLQSQLEASGRDVRSQVENEVSALVSRWKWLLALVVTAAGLGGYASIPGWIDGKVEKAVDSRVQNEVSAALKEQQLSINQAMFEAQTRLDVTLQETEKRVEGLRREVDDAASTFVQQSKRAVAEFEKQAAAALEDVGKHASKTKAEITERARLVIVQDQAGGTSVVEASKTTVMSWFGDVPTNVVAIGGAELTQFASESSLAGKTMGAFSHHFQHALASSDGDADKNGQITWSEAVAWTNQKLSSSQYPQRPVIEGERSNETAFLAAKKSSGKLGQLRAVLVGCSRYKDKNLPKLQGPANDAREMAQLIESAAKRERLTAAKIELNVLIDEEATRARILEQINKLIAEAKPDDLVVFYFSGHVLREATTKRLLVYDFDDSQPPLRATEIASLFGQCAATVVIIVDG